VTGISEPTRYAFEAGMSVTFVLTQSLECPSGVGRYWPMARSLARRGYRVSIVALHPGYQELTERDLVRDGVAVHYVGQMHVKKCGTSKHYYNALQFLGIAAMSTFKLAWAAVVSRSDVYHIAKAQPMNGVAALVLLALGQRVYLDCDDYEAVSNRFSAEWQRRVVTWFEDHLPVWVDGVTVNSRFLQMRVRALLGHCKRIVLVPNAVSNERFRIPAAEEVIAFKAQNQLEGHLIVAYVGSMELGNHPVDLLLKGFAQVASEMPHAILILVGGGRDFSALCQLAIDLGIESVVRFFGRVPPSEISMYYAVADVSVDPVHDDDIARARSPLKLYESLALGTPVITGDVGDRREMLHGIEAMLVQAGSADALGRRLLELLGNDVIRAELVKWAVAHRAQFDWESRIDDFLCVYETLQ